VYGNRGIYPVLPKPPYPADPATMDRDELRAWYEGWVRTEEGKGFEKKLAQLRGDRIPIGFQLNADGSFRVEDVPAGEYELHISVAEPPPPQQCAAGQTLATCRYEFTIPAVPGERSDAPLDLGELALTPATSMDVGNLKVGEAAPAFEVRTLDGKALKLSDFRGKVVLLDFWATWCGPCVGETPHLKEVHEAFGADQRFAMIGLSLDQDAKAPADYVARNGLKWHQGFLGEWSRTKLPAAYGVRGIPSIFLIGPDGKVLAKSLRGPAIEAAVSEALDGLTGSD